MTSRKLISRKIFLVLTIFGCTNEQATQDMQEQLSDQSQLSTGADNVADNVIDESEALATQASNAESINSAMANSAAINSDVPANNAPTANSTPAPEQTPAAASSEMGSPYGRITWIGYNYSEQAGTVSADIIVDGSPVFEIVQGKNRIGQREIIVRYINTEVRSKLKRDLDASEFHASVAYVRTKHDAEKNQTDVVLTLRDDVEPAVVKKDSSVRFVFAILDKYKKTKVAEARAAAKAEAINPEAVEALELEEPAPPPSTPAYVPNPARSVFKETAPASTGAPEVPQAVPAGREHIQRLNKVMEESGASVERFSVFGVAQAEGPQPAPQQNEIVGSDEGVGHSTKRAIKFDFRAAPVSEVVRAIAAESGLNFVIAPEIGSRKVTMSLKDVPWDVALRAILESNGLGMADMGNGLVRIDTLQKFAEDKEAQEKAKQATEALTPTKILVMRLSYARAEETAKLIEAMLPKSSSASAAQARNYSRFRVQPDKRSNSLIVEATPNELGKIKALIERIDLQTPQVKIASRIVEVSKTFDDYLGISWGTPFNMDGGRGLGFGGLPFPNYMLSNFSVDPGISPRVAGANFRFGSVNNSMALDLRIRAEESRGNVEVIQNQDVLVQDTEDALIATGSQDFFQLPATVNQAATLVQVDYLLKLKVNPKITADGAVQMKLEVTSDTPKASTTGATAKDTRQVSSVLIRRSGETAVIGAFPF
jgi:type IV pilus secretin PilQ/predicted competence protein